LPPGLIFETYTVSNSISAGAQPRITLGSLRRSLVPLAEIERVLLLREERKEEDWGKGKGRCR